MNKNEKNGQNSVATSAQMIEDITNEISEAMTLAIGSDKKVNILGGEFNVSWFESMGFYTFMVEGEDWSIETSVKIEVWNELQEEAQEDIANGLARILYAKMLLTFSQVSFNKKEG